MLPYWGPGWYWRAEVEWMLDGDIVRWDEIRYTLTASSRFPAAYLTDKLKRLEARWREAQEATMSECDAKFVLNAMFGIWSIINHEVFHLDVASDPDGIVATIMRKMPSPGSEHDGTYLLHDYISKGDLHYVGHGPERLPHSVHS